MSGKTFSPQEIFKAKKSFISFTIYFDIPVFLLGQMKLLYKHTQTDHFWWFLKHWNKLWQLSILKPKFSNIEVLLLFEIIKTLAKYTPGKPFMKRSKWYICRKLKIGICSCIKEMLNWRGMKKKVWSQIQKCNKHWPSEIIFTHMSITFKKNEAQWQFLLTVAWILCNCPLMEEICVNKMKFPWPSFPLYPELLPPKAAPSRTEDSFRNSMSSNLGTCSSRRKLVFH